MGDSASWQNHRRGGPSTCAERAGRYALGVIFRLHFRRYALPFRAPVRTAHGVWAKREGVVVRVESESGVAGYGEAAPVPGFGTETAQQDEDAIRSLGEKVERESLLEIPPELPGLRNAVSTALRRVEGSTAEVASRRDSGDRSREDRGVKPLAPSESHETRPRSATEKDYWPVAALLPAGRAVLEQVRVKAEAGFRVFKWKVGVGDLGDELGLLDDLCAALPNGAKLRLDANGAWERRQAERWLERCADRPVEFVEQPVAPSTRGSEDLLLGLAEDFPTPLALDESIVGDGDIERWLGRGWKGIFVVKISLLADVEQTLARLTKARADVVFSSALETAVGARAALEAAWTWPGETRALGFGVWPLFADARCDGPHAAPFIRREDVVRLDPEAVWTALS